MNKGEERKRKRRRRRRRKRESDEDRVRGSEVISSSRTSFVSRNKMDTCRAEVEEGEGEREDRSMHEKESVER